MQNDPLVSAPPGLEELLEIGKRMRRDTESLLLLAGHEPGVRTGRARRLADVLADATAAAEEPRRVDVRNPTAAGIAPAAATELLHIVAELIDYVTAVYPGARVDISSRTEPPGGLAVEVRAEGAGRYDPEGLGGRRALGAAERLARRSRTGIGLRLPGVTTGLVASLHVPGSAVELDEPERSLPWAGGGSVAAQESVRDPVRESVLPRRGTNGGGGAIGRSIRDANPFGDFGPASNGSGSYGSAGNGGGPSSNGSSNGGGLPVRPAAYQPSGQHPLPPLQHSQPTPLQHSQPTPLQHSQPMPLQHSQPTPLQHSQPMPLQHSQPTPLQHSQPMPLQHSQPTPLQHSRPMPLSSPSLPASLPLPPSPEPALSAFPARERPPSQVDELFGPLLDLAHDPADESIATPIFEAIASAWFREDAPSGETALDRPSQPGKDPLDWETPSDPEWREAAARAAQPEPAPQTAGGLPRRRPGTQLVPPPRNRKPLPDIGPAERVPDRVRDRLSTYQRGLREGRHRAEPPKQAPRPDRDPFDPEAW